MADASAFSAFDNIVRMQSKVDSEARKILPMFVVVGIQSSGKSSLIESLLNFPFNIVANNTGTRCPLYLSLMNDPSCLVPVCQVDKEEVPYKELWKAIDAKNR